MISKGNHVTTSRNSCCLPSAKKQKHDFQVFAFIQCIKQIDLFFVISRIIKVLVRVISLSLHLWLITLTSTLIILDITKTSSNNCLLFAQAFCAVSKLPATKHMLQDNLTTPPPPRHPYPQFLSDWPTASLFTDFLFSLKLFKIRLQELNKCKCNGSTRVLYSLLWAC